MGKQCSIDGCDKLSRRRTWCNMHYNRWHRHGVPNYARPGIMERFWAKVESTERNQCWEWKGSKSPDGYGSFFHSGHLVGAHRFSYQALVGHVPPAMQIDHLCKVRNCVNPSHLEIVSLVENIRRGMSGKLNNFQKSKTHCPQGHEYNEANTHLYKGTRRCQECNRMRANNNYRDHSRATRGL